MLNINRRSLIALLLVLGSADALASQQRLDGPVTRIYFVRHGELDSNDPTIPLNARGHERAAELVRVFERVEVTHVFSSHTLRSQQSVRPTAEAHRLTVTPMPPPRHRHRRAHGHGSFCVTTRDRASRRCARRSASG